MSVLKVGGEIAGPPCRTTLQPQVCAFKSPKEMITSFVFMAIIPYFPASTKSILQPFLQTPHPLHTQSMCIPVIPRTTFNDCIKIKPLSHDKLQIDSCLCLKGQAGMWPHKGQANSYSWRSLLLTDIYPHQTLIGSYSKGHSFLIFSLLLLSSSQSLPFFFFAGEICDK